MISEVEYIDQEWCLGFIYTFRPVSVDLRSEARLTDRSMSGLAMQAGPAENACERCYNDRISERGKV